MVGVLISASLFLMISAFVLSFWRLVRGPDPVDRVVCLDLLALLAAGLMAIQAVWVRESVYLDAVLVLSIVAFFGTIVFARYIERRAFE
jgi:multicomponent Na+:H+ antiporter subunit F